MCSASFLGNPFLFLPRGVCERVHAKPRGHRPGAIQRHLPTTAGARVADALPRGSCDHSHVDAVRTAHGALPSVHGRAASGASCLAVHAPVAQCAGSPNLVRVPTSHSWEFPSLISISHKHDPESCSCKYPPPWDPHSGLLPSSLALPSCTPNPTSTSGTRSPALETSVLQSSSISDYSWTGTR